MRGGGCSRCSRRQSLHASLVHVLVGMEEARPRVGGEEGRSGGSPSGAKDSREVMVAARGDESDNTPQG